MVKPLLDRDAALKTVNADGDRDTPLCAAAWQGHTEIVKLLLSKGAKMTSVILSGFTVLTAACLNGYTGIDHILLRNGAYEEAVSGDIRCGSIANRIAYKRTQDLLDFITEHHHVDLHKVDFHMRSPLHLAVLGRMVATVNRLVNLGLDLTALDAKGDDAVNDAALGGSLITLSAVLDKLSDHSFESPHCSALHWAYKVRKAEAIELLKSRGCKSKFITVHHMPGEWTPVAVAIYHGHEEIVRKMSIPSQHSRY